ncbi:hypothetical protein Q5752_007025 [Cryptotrichosporon argae]
MPVPATPALPPDIIANILSHLGFPTASQLPDPPLVFLASHLRALPPSLLIPFSSVTTPRSRASIPLIRSRRLLYASTVPPPPELSTERGRLRWPVLWERLGGSREVPETSVAQREEEEWARSGFMDGRAGSQHVKKLGALLREDQEVREWETARAARREEYRLDQVGEEFEDESDDEGDGDAAAAQARMTAVVNPDQAAVKQLFERQLLELFLDGKDPVDYDPVDFNEPVEGDPIAARDAEDHYFDDEEPSRTPNGHIEGAGLGAGAESLQNGQGEYDY